MRKDSLDQDRAGRKLGLRSRVLGLWSLSLVFDLADSGVGLHFAWWFLIIQARIQPQTITETKDLRPKT